MKRANDDMKRAHDDSDDDSSKSQDGKNRRGKDDNCSNEAELHTIESLSESQLQERRRELNRLSKMRCRKRRIETQNRLQSEQASLSRELSDLQRENRELRNEFSECLNASYQESLSRTNQIASTSAASRSLDNVGSPSLSHQPEIPLAINYPSFASRVEMQPSPTNQGQEFDNNLYSRQAQVIRSLQNCPLLSPYPTQLWNAASNQPSNSFHQQLSPYENLIAIMQSAIARQSPGELLSNEPATRQEDRSLQNLPHHDPVGNTQPTSNAASYQPSTSPNQEQASLFESLEAILQLSGGVEAQRDGYLPLQNLSSVLNAYATETRNSASSQLLSLILNQQLSPNANLTANILSGMEQQSSVHVSGGVELRGEGNPFLQNLATQLRLSRAIPAQSSDLTPRQPTSTLSEQALIDSNLTTIYAGGATRQEGQSIQNLPTNAANTNVAETLDSTSPQPSLSLDANLTAMIQSVMQRYTNPAAAQLGRHSDQDVEDVNVPNLPPTS